MEKSARCGAPSSLRKALQSGARPKKCAQRVCPPTRCGRARRARGKDREAPQRQRKRKKKSRQEARLRKSFRDAEARGGRDLCRSAMAPQGA